MFGKLLYNISDNEQLFLGTSDDLNCVEMWKYNRPADMSRVEEIKSYITKSRVVDGIIYVAEVNDDFGRIKYICYDGNHRRLAIKGNNYPVLINVMWKVTDKEVKEKFIALNMANPVPELYMIEGDEEVIERMKGIVNDVVRDLVKLFPKHVSTSKSPNRPNFNRDQMVDRLSKYMIDNKMYDIERSDLIKKLLGLNVKYMGGYGIPKKISNKILDKCEKNKCYLFLKDFTEDLDV